MTIHKESDIKAGFIYDTTSLLNINMNVRMYLPNAVPGVKLIVTIILISLLLTTTPDIIIVADTTPDDSNPSYVDDENVITATV